MSHLIETRVYAKILDRVIAMVLALSACGSSDTGSPARAEAEFPEQMFFVGDSNLDGVAAPFVALSEARHSDLTIETQESVIYGVHLETGFDGRVGRIQGGAFDVVVLEQDFEDSDPVTFMESVRKYDTEIVAAGAETVLFMPWEHDTTNHKVSIDDIASVYTSIGDELGALVAPLGLAFSSSLSERPDLDLYSGDREHANLRGRYLAASVLYATIFGISPEGPSWMSPEMADKADMSEEDAAYLDRIAWQTVTEYRDGT